MWQCSPGSFCTHTHTFRYVYFISTWKKRGYYWPAVVLYSEGLKDKDIGQSLCVIRVNHLFRQRENKFSYFGISYFLTVRLNNDTSGHLSLCIVLPFIIFLFFLSNLFGSAFVSSTTLERKREKRLSDWQLNQIGFLFDIMQSLPFFFSLRGHCDLFRCVEPLCPSLFSDRSAFSMSASSRFTKSSSYLSCPFIYIFPSHTHTHGRRRKYLLFFLETRKGKMEWNPIRRARALDRFRASLGRPKLKAK